MSWNKYNLYNIFTLKQTHIGNSVPWLQKSNTFKQQQKAKQVVRKYHGYGIPERVFKNQLFNPRFNVVAGGKRGTRPLLWGGLFHGLERRLDHVIYRSLFATSIKQARQMVVHGNVELNGKIEHRPGVLLKPGDIYHVDPKIVKKFISSYFHKGQETFVAHRRKEHMQQRVDFLRRKGLTSETGLPHRPRLAQLFEYDPFTPIAIQGRHPIFGMLDKEAVREEELYQKYHRFYPKPYITPHIYLPAYLEVSYRSCTGCFVRLPQIKKDGIMEIPSPFPVGVHERAGLYYTRFGKTILKTQRGYRGYRLFWSKKKQRR